ncbi:hypothetical protein ACVHYJ_12050 [Burkholderia pyrrocinia]
MSGFKRSAMCARRVDRSLSFWIASAFAAMSAATSSESLLSSLLLQPANAIEIKMALSVSIIFIS